jgi:predicted component of type VI protein secretion system
MVKKSEPNEVQVLASLINGSMQIQSVSAQRAISARIDIHTLARVDSMAKQAKKSRNDMLNMLLDVACFAVYEHLEQPVIEELQSRESFELEAAGSQE